MEPQVLRVYTDGSCLGNPGGPGGWGYAHVLADSDGDLYMTRFASGGEKSTTNNRMEILAVIKGIENIRSGFTIEVWTDSQYVINAAEGKWTPSKNLDLWNRLHFTLQSLGEGCSFHWVPGHAGDTYNEMADTLATNAAKDLKEWSINERQRRRRHRSFGRRFWKERRELALKSKMAQSTTSSAPSTTTPVPVSESTPQKESGFVEPAVDKEL